MNRYGSTFHPKAKAASNKAKEQKIIRTDKNTVEITFKFEEDKTAIILENAHTYSQGSSTFLGKGHFLKIKENSLYPLVFTKTV